MGSSSCSHQCSCMDNITVCKTCNVSTIQTALAMACVGGTIFVNDSGVYNESLSFMKENITLDCGGSVLDGSGGGDGIYLWPF